MIDLKEELEQLYGTKNPDEIVTAARSTKETAEKLRLKCEKGAKDLASLQEKYSLAISEANKKNQSIKIYLDMVKSKAIKSDPDTILRDLIDGVVVKGKSIFEVLNLPSLRGN